jgi:ankyrin repeat protein
MIAIKALDIKTVDKILNHPCNDVNIQNKHGKTALMYAIIHAIDHRLKYMQNAQKSIITMLIDKADITIRDNAGETALDKLDQLCRTRSIKLLCDLRSSLLGM